MAETLTRWFILTATIALLLSLYKCAVDGIESIPDAATENR